jgi:hypothetical protein
VRDEKRIFPLALSGAVLGGLQAVKKSLNHGWANAEKEIHPPMTRMDVPRFSFAEIREMGGYVFYLWF